MMSVLVSGCKTVQTISDGVTNPLDFRSVHEKFEGKFIDSTYAQVSSKDYEGARRELQETRDNELIKLATKDKEDNTQRSWNFSKNDMVNQAKAAQYIDAPAFEKYMDGIADKLLDNWPGEPPSQPIRTRISSNQAYDAHTKGDGILVINLGVIKSAESEDELAFIIAHEMAHNLLQHAMRQDYLDAQSLWLETGFNAASTLVMAKNLDMTDGANGIKTLSLSNQATVSKALAKNSANLELMQNLSANLWGSSWSRALEEEADLLALDLIIRTGYSKNASRKAMQRIAASSAGTESLLAEIGKNQQEAITAAFKEKGLEGMLNQGSGLLTSGLMEVGSSLVSKLKENHASPEAREEYIQAYANREYRRSPRVRYNRDHLKAIEHPQTKATLSAHQNITEALSALAADDIDNAYKLGKSVLSSPAKNSSRSRTLMYQIRKYQGKDALALKNLELIADWDLAPVNTYDAIIREYRTSGRYSKAEQYLENGQKIYGKEFFYPEAIMLSRSKGDNTFAVSTYTECLSTKNATIKSACKEVIGNLAPTSSNPLLNQPESGNALTNPLKSLLPL